MSRRTAAQVTAQVAIEAIINTPDAFDKATKEQVLEFAEQQGVSTFYLDMVR